MAGKYDPAKKLVKRFPRFPKLEWIGVEGHAILRCGCGGLLFFVHKTGMQRQRHTKEASHPKIVAVCPNPKCRQKLRLD
jgi:hypothetical protein